MTSFELAQTLVGLGAVGVDGRERRGQVGADGGVVPPGDALVRHAEADRSLVLVGAPVAQQTVDLLPVAGRALGLFTVGVITCKPTKKEAEDYYHYSIVEHADWSAVDAILARAKDPQ